MSVDQPLPDTDVDPELLAAIGPQLPQPDPRGWLAFEYLPPTLQAREDSWAAADRAEVENDEFPHPFRRMASWAERTLLRHLGHPVPNGPLLTVVEWTSRGVRNRRWPELEATTTAPAADTTTGGGTYPGEDTHP